MMSRSELCTRSDSKGSLFMLVGNPADSAICCVRERAETQSRNWGVAAPSPATVPLTAPTIAEPTALCVRVCDATAPIPPAMIPPADGRSHHADWPGSVERTAFCRLRDGIATSILAWSVV